jgi:hypothetical protein
MSRPFVRRFTNHEVIPDQIDRTFQDLLRLVNGGLNGSNLKRGTKLAVGNTSSTVKYAWFEPYSLVRLQGLNDATSQNTVYMGSTPGLTGPFICVRAACMLRIDNGTLATYPIVTLKYGDGATATTFGYINTATALPANRSTVGKVASDVWVGSTNIFIDNIPANNAIFGVITPGGSAAVAGQCIVSLTFKIVHQS